VFSKRAKRKLITHQKFYYFDVGVYQAIRPKGFLDGVENVWGAAVETFLLQELRAYIHYYALNYEIFFWRSVNKVEVDFVLYGEKQLFAIEVKASTKFDEKDFKGLKEFKKDYPEAKLFYLYCGFRAEEYREIKVLPIVDFLKDIRKYLTN
jgi:uncharacterized protein